VLGSHGLLTVGDGGTLRPDPAIAGLIRALAEPQLQIVATRTTSSGRAVQWIAVADGRAAVMRSPRRGVYELAPGPGGDLLPLVLESLGLSPDGHAEAAGDGADGRPVVLSMHEWLAFREGRPEPAGSAAGAELLDRLRAGAGGTVLELTMVRVSPALVHGSEHVFFVEPGGLDWNLEVELDEHGSPACVVATPGPHGRLTAVVADALRELTPA
jgi:hypothetical protein